MSSFNLANDIKKRNKNLKEKIFYANDLKGTWKLIDEKLKPNDILLIMGAGDVFKIADDLIKKDKWIYE